MVALTRLRLDHFDVQKVNRSLYHGTASAHSSSGGRPLEKPKGLGFRMATGGELGDKGAGRRALAARIFGYFREHNEFHQGRYRGCLF
jgi:hypothetical protein